MIDHPSLQDTSFVGEVSPAAVGLAASILAGGLSLDDAIGRSARHFLQQPQVEGVAVALTSFAPDDTADWAQLGGRAWVRQWTRPGSNVRIVPEAGAGPEAALSMPWLSRFARTEIVALVDRGLLPPEAAVDREELARVGIHSLIASTFSSGGEMFGSLSVGGVLPGRWPVVVIQDYRLLNAAIASRLTLENSRRALAEAIDAGTEAQLAYQQFFGAVGHELRTPLAAVLGYTEVLLDDAQHATAEVVSEGMLRDGPVILRACEQLLAVVDNLLGAGRTLSSDDQRQAVVVADAVSDVVHWHRTPANTAGVEMLVDVDPAATVWAHASGVRQVLTNLLGNAIAHHRPGGGTLHVSVQRLRGESANEMVRIIVRDDGPGLTPDQVQHAFEPFVRFAAPGTKGSGLGLSISRTIAERDGGAVRGESTPGEGSSFWLELPAFQPSSA